MILKKPKTTESFLKQDENGIDVSVICKNSVILEVGNVAKKKYPNGLLLYPL